MPTSILEISLNVSSLFANFFICLSVSSVHSLGSNLSVFYCHSNTKVVISRTQNCLLMSFVVLWGGFMNAKMPDSTGSLDGFNHNRIRFANSCDGLLATKETCSIIYRKRFPSWCSIGHVDLGSNPGYHHCIFLWTEHVVKSNRNTASTVEHKCSLIL